MKSKFFALTLTLLISSNLISQTACEQTVEQLNNLLQHRLDRVEKLVDDVMWFQRLNDIAYVDKLFITGPPPAKEKIQLLWELVIL